MLQKEPPRWEDNAQRPRHSPDKETSDCLLGRRSSPPTDSTIHQQPADELQSDVVVESSEQIERLIRQARSTLEPERHKRPAESLVELLRNGKASDLAGDLERYFGDEDPLAPSTGGFSVRLSARDRTDSEGLYSLLERPIVNLKWRSDGR